MKFAIGCRPLLFAALVGLPVLARGFEILTPNGLEPVRIGMSRIQAEKALGAKLDLDIDASGGEGACSQATRPGDRRITYMFENYRVVRIDVGGKGIVTPEGAGVGTTELRLKQIYPRAIFSVHPYLGNEGHYVVVKFPPKNRDLLFETDHGTVTSFRIGLPEPVAYIEGCN